MSTTPSSRATPVWIDGALVDATDARIRYDDHGITVGDGVFETIKLAAGTPFALTRHLARLARSAAAMHIPSPSPDELRHAVGAVASAHGGDRDGFLRVTLTAGPGPLGSNRDELHPTLLVAVRPGQVRVDPTDVVVVDWTRNERGALAGVKSTSYGENVVALAVAAGAGASEALFANNAGRLCEGTGSNVFVVVDDELVTPPLSSGCLDGVTRALLIEAGVGREADVPMAALDRCTEMFLVSTGREVQPVRAVRHHDGRSLDLPAAPGPHTEAARQVWLDRIAPLTDP